MEQSTPRTGSICLPTRLDKLRFLLMLAALGAGGMTGAAFYLVFAQAAESIALGVTTVDIAFHLVDVACSLYAVSSIAPAQTRIESAAPGVRPAAPARVRAWHAIAAGARRLAARVRRLFGRFGGSGAAPSLAVRTY